MSKQARVFEIDSISGVFEIKNYGGYTYNVYLDGREIDVFSYAGLPSNAEIVCEEWVEDYEQEQYGLDR
jgi:hypothetical protein